MTVALAATCAAANGVVESTAPASADHADKQPSTAASSGSTNKQAELAGTSSAQTPAAG